jgi:signal transduction histidine kinase
MILSSFLSKPGYSPGLIQTPIYGNMEPKGKEVSLKINVTRNDMILTQNNDNILLSGKYDTYGVASSLQIRYVHPISNKDNEDNDQFERMGSALKSLNSGIWTFELATNSLSVCIRCKDLIPILTNETVKLVELQALIVAEYREQFLNAFNIALKTNASIDLEVPTIVKGNNEFRWLRITGISTTGKSNNFPKIHGSIEDISNRKFNELLRQDYLAMVSHDLKSPLSVIKLYMQLCERAANEPQQHLSRDMFKKAGSQIDKMTGMIESYLEFPATGNGEINYKPTKFDIKQLLEEMINDMRLLNPGYILILKAIERITVVADRTKIGQVIQNLLSNAIKYSSKIDIITINLRTAENFIQVEIQDHGVGIKPADQKKIFDRFYRAEPVNDLQVRGYGIGLYLTKQIIKQHQGKIWLTSEVNKGSKFYFTLPYS